MSHYIIPAPADSNYNTVWDDARVFVSRYADVPVTADMVPNSFFDRDIFVLPAEIQVLTHKKRAIAVVPTDDAEYPLLLTLTTMRIGIITAPRFPQQVRRMMLQQSGEYSELKMDDFIDLLEKAYAEVLNPATDVPTPGGGGSSSSSGTITPSVLVTDSQLD